MNTTASREATCVGCGCTDSHACPHGCTWLAVNRDDGTGVCSNCLCALDDWREQQARGVDCTPQVAWCWASGLIEIGDAMPAESPDGGGAIQIASGPRYALEAEIGVRARHAYQTGKLLVPGVPEAGNQHAKGDALARWLAWCGRCKSRDGVTWARMTEVAE